MKKTNKQEIYMSIYLSQVVAQCKCLVPMPEREYYGTEGGQTGPGRQFHHQGRGKEASCSVIGECPPIHSVIFYFLLFKNAD